MTKKVQRKYINISLNNKRIKFQVDPGSDLTIINAETWKKMSIPEKLEKNSKSVIGEKLKSMGETFMNVFF